MKKFESELEFEKVVSYVVLTVLLTGCSSEAMHKFDNSSMKMAHHTTILNHQTHRLVSTDPDSSSTVNFEYEEIISQ